MFGRGIDLLRIAFLVLALAGCGGGSTTHQLLVADVTAAPASAIAGRHTIFVATTREAAADKAEVFSGARSPDLNLVKVDITVPASHKLGAIERPKKGPRDPAKYFVAETVTAFDEDAFVAFFDAYQFKGPERFPPDTLLPGRS